MGSLGKWELVSYINGRCSTCHFEEGGGGGVNHRFLSCIVYQHKPRVAVAV